MTIPSFIYPLGNGIEMSMCCLKSLNKRNEWQMTSHPPAHPHNNLPTVCPQWGSYDASLGSTSNSSTLSQQRPHSTTSPQLAHYEGIISIVVKAQGIQINILSTKSPLNSLPTLCPLWRSCDICSWSTKNLSTYYQYSPHFGVGDLKIKYGHVGSCWATYRLEVGTKWDQSWGG